MLLDRIILLSRYKPTAYGIVILLEHLSIIKHRSENHSIGVEVQRLLFIQD